MNDMWCLICLQRCGSGSLVINVVVGIRTLMVVGVIVVALVWL